MKTCPVCGATYADSNAFCPADGTTLRAADADGDLVGSVIADRYLVTDLLGEGGMGKVYLARHVRLPQQAAIKVLRPDQVRDAASVARFTREAANASRIDHDRVARVYDFGETGEGVVYLAMEFVAGRTLTKLIADEGALPPQRTAALVRQIADGLDAAHRLGIVHRDLKPDNILVIEGEHGTDDRVKVVDFGIAKAFGADEAGGAALTRTGYVVGTPEFMSPEQLLGGAVDARSDVYALALVAYECLTGDLPFSRNTPDRGLTARLVEAPRRLEVVAPSVPWAAGIQSVFDSALDRDPDQRPATAGAFARALFAAVDAWAGGTDRLMPEAGAAIPAAVPPTAPAPAVSRGADTVPAPVSIGAGSAPGAVLGARDGGRPASAGSRRPLVLAGGAAVLVAAVAVVAWRGRAPDPSAGTVGTASSTTPPAVAAASGGAVSPPPSTALPAAPPAPSAANPPATTPPATRPVASVSAPPPGAAPRAAPAASPAASPDDGAAARRTLDSLQSALDPGSATAADGRAAAGALRALLPRLRTTRDSTWAYIRLVDAHLLTGDQARACSALRTAQSAARTADQREAVRRYDEELGCQ